VTSAQRTIAASTWLAILALAPSGCAWFGASSRQGVASGAAALRVLTYNIQSGHGNLEATAAAIRALHPDIVALQEVDVHWAERSAFDDQAATLGRRLGMHVRFAPIYRMPAPGKPMREFGVALLTRFPIAAWNNDTLTRLSTQEPNPVPAPAPGLLDAILDIGGTRVRVLNAHLDYRAEPSVRRRQVAEMVRYLGPADVPTIVFGDLNAPPEAPEISPLLQRLHDAWPRDNGNGFTYPAEAPSKRIDYVLVSQHFTVVDASVPATEASDHRPVVVDLSLGAPAAAQF
jgi:endonuclease/exonuclease/phosphatase family metal-dependent hydrolase